MNARRTFLMISAVLSALAAGSAFALSGMNSIVASGKVVHESRPVSGYTGVSLAIPGTLVIRQGREQSVSIEADDNLMPEIETVVDGKTLKIRFRSMINVTGRATLRVLVTGPTFDDLSVSGSGDIVSESIRSNSLSLAVAGSGDLRIAKTEVETLAVSIAGSGDVGVAGRAGEVSVKISGSGDIDAGRLESRRVKITIAGSGDAVVWARDTLEVSVAGSGDVRYRGDPDVKRRIAGSGSVKRIGPAP